MINLHKHTHTHTDTHTHFFVPHVFRPAFCPSAVTCTYTSTYHRKVFHTCGTCLCPYVRAPYLTPSYVGLQCLYEAD